VPVSAQAGRVIKLGGELPANLAIDAYYNTVRPEYGARWQPQAQMIGIF
jgi:hypothetical protein